MSSGPSSPSDTLKKVDALIASESTSQNISEILESLNLSPSNNSSTFDKKLNLNDTDCLLNIFNENSSSISPLVKTPAGSKSSVFVSTPNTPSSPKLENEIQSFLNSLHTQYDISVNSLDDVITQLNKLIEKTKMK